MLGQMMGVGVLRATIGVVRTTAEKVKVDAVHCFHPRPDFPVKMPCFVGQSESGISLKRKLGLRLALA